MNKTVQVLLFLLGIATICHAQWKRQKVQLDTRWTGQVSETNVHKEYPRPILQRGNWTNLNGLWSYSIVGKSTQPTKFDDQILVPFPIESALSGVKKALKPDEILWYRKVFSFEKKKSSRTILHFGAVDWEATVYVNKKNVGTHTGGYTSFSYDVTDALKNGENEVIVRVYDPTDKGIGPHGKQVLDPANIYYTASSGIWQTVWMETVPLDYIKNLSISPDIDNEVLNLTVRLSSANAANRKLSIKIPGCKTCRIIEKSSSKDQIDLKIKIPAPRMWTPDDPFLYDLEVGLGMDRVKSYFGMRKVSVGKDKDGYDRIMLNNKYVYNLGTLDQGFWPDGLYTAPTDEALKFDIEAIKSMGFNTIRKHIKVEPARWYYYTDRLGILVWQDLVNPNQQLPEGSKKQFEKESEEIVDQLRNYPSITTWVLFNEKWGQYEQKRLTNWLKAKDPSRLVNGHSGEFLYVNGQLRSPSEDPYVDADMTDVHSYPNPMMPIKQAGKAWVCGEFGGIGVPVQGHLWDDINSGWGYDGLVTPGTMLNQYSKMIDTLVKFERLGLSGSIYTQPFDVESEQNGLITYDREVAKVKLESIRASNKKLWSAIAVDTLANLLGFSSPDTVDRYNEWVLEYNSGRADSAFLRKLTLSAIKKQDNDMISKAGDRYYLSLNNRFTNDNLLIIGKTTKSSLDSGFMFYWRNKARINGVLGRGSAEKKVMSVIYREEIEPFDKVDHPDWSTMERKLASKYGDIGEELVWACETAFYASSENIPGFEASFLKYYRRALTSGVRYLNANALCWWAFLKSNDDQVLKLATNVMKEEISQRPGDYHSIDTYANLLYKTGDLKGAIFWEEKAITVSGSDEALVETLSKMKTGVPTWLVSGSK
ncbi:sugar-binding domain-containing protein [Pedobacter sp. JY14-1]|uniref:glycoside hydrolase family 2 protein n=1 Tax=Pedobacter sp. JY14-1 TaxID=3034151 RepID=UPI0023E2DF93|nr:sugar-binding domain-containing protein [Pedobacter sp. JY14-1]